MGDSAEDPSFATAAPPLALPPHGELACLGVDAHSQDHDPGQKSAYRLRLYLGRAAMDATGREQRVVRPGNGMMDLPA